ncbi:Serine/threonine-protein kinase minibrain [Pelomyxa schiedti]|nr:Serine/threonine-protein kinase minibrain [Pelomyxa schiedti]
MSSSARVVAMSNLVDPRYHTSPVVNYFQNNMSNNNTNNINTNNSGGPSPNTSPCVVANNNVVNNNKPSTNIQVEGQPSRYSPCTALFGSRNTTVTPPNTTVTTTTNSTPQQSQTSVVTSSLASSSSPLSSSLSSSSSSLSSSLSHPQSSCSIPPPAVDTRTIPTNVPTNAQNTTGGGTPRKKVPCLHKITIHLIHTYQAFQENRTKRIRAVPKNPSMWDDKNGDCIIRVGDVLADRFEVLSLLGKGSFGQVVKCIDRTKLEEVAVKIIKNKASFFSQALFEIKILNHLNLHDPYDQAKIVRMKEHFKWRGHLCLVFELLSNNLYELLSLTRFHGLSLSLVRKFAVQLLCALEFLCSSSVKIIHCDLKPENILLRNPKRSAIKVIDFGSSCYCSDTMYKYIQSRYYRSPEVLLGLTYSFPIDMWSLGCILVELHTGDPLFAGKNEPEQLLKIVEVMGIPPAHMIDRSPKLKKLFQMGPTGSYQIHSTLQSRVQPRSLSQIIGVETGGPKGRHWGESGHSTTEYLKFKDLIEKMLSYDPAKRITPSVALQHSFFKQTNDEATETPSTTSSPAPSPSPGSQPLSATSHSSATTTVTPQVSPLGSGSHPSVSRAITTTSSCNCSNNNYSYNNTAAAGGEDNTPSLTGLSFPAANTTKSRRSPTPPNKPPTSTHTTTTTKPAPATSSTSSPPSTCTTNSINTNTPISSITGATTITGTSGTTTPSHPQTAVCPSASANITVAASQFSNNKNATNDNDNDSNTPGHKKAVASHTKTRRNPKRSSSV